MILKGVPHVCFKISPDSKLRDEGKLLPYLGSELAGKLDVRIKKRFRVFALRSIGVEFRGKNFIIGLLRDRLDADQWYMHISSMNMDQGLRNFCSDVAEMKEISAKIHEILVTSSDIAYVRWFFRENGVQPKGLASPEELPWGT